MGGCNNTETMNRKEVFLIGGSGAVGKALYNIFDHDEYSVYSFNSHEATLPALRNIENETDIVINLAGVTTACELHKKDANACNVIDVNCVGAVDVLDTFLPHMRKQKYGRIIFISSVYSSINIKGQGVYSASKAFVDKLTKIAALENAEYGVTVNSIQLGYMGIGMGTMPIEDTQNIMRRIGMGRFCTPQELYNTIEYIINTEYLTGQNIRLDGGIK